MQKDTLTVRLSPPDHLYRLYVYGNTIGLYHSRDGRSNIMLDGVAVVMYYWPQHRRAYIVRAADSVGCIGATTLPEVRSSVGIIYQARGRRFDHLKRALYNLERRYGKEVYGFGTGYWQRLGCLLDASHGTGRAATAWSSLVGLKNTNNLA
jgi:hypothetical protein